MCVLGLGLIGGSLMRAAAAAGREVFGYNRSVDGVKAAQFDGFDATEKLDLVTLERHPGSATIAKPPARQCVSDDAAPDEGLQQQRLHDALRAAMDRLSPDHRAVVDLTYFHDLGYREIAEIMSCPVDTVKTRMFHARRRLKEAMAGGFEDWL